MPAKEEQSGLLAGLGTQLVNAFNEGKAKPVELNFGGQLPGGIDNGVAQLRDLKIGKFKEGTPNAGKPYFMGQAVVVFPKEHKGAKVAGLFTRIGPEALCDTLDRGGETSRKTFAQHFQWMLDHLKQLGWNPAEIQGKTAQQVEEILLAGMKALCKAAPFFRFRTWKGDKQVIARDTDGKIYLFSEDDNGLRKRLPGKGPYFSEQVAKMQNPFAGREPMVQHVWGDVLADYHLPTNGDVQDETGSVYSPSKRGALPFDEFDGRSENGSNSATGSEADSDGDDLDQLVRRAIEADDQAQDELNERALAAGWPEEEITSAAGWSDVATMIRNPKDADKGAAVSENEHADTDSEPEALAAPAVKSIVNYRPHDPKTNKPSRRTVECEVVAVNFKQQTTTLLSLRDRKTQYKDVPWDQVTV